MNPYLPLALSNLRARLFIPPSRSIIEAARTFLILYPRSDLPDWVEILAHGNPDFLPAVYQAAIDDINASRDPP